MTWIAVLLALNVALAMAQTSAVVNVTLVDAPLSQLLQLPGWYPGGAMAIRTDNKTLYTTISGGASWINNRLFLDAVLPPDIHAYPAPHHDALQIAAVGNWGALLVVGTYGVWFGIPDVTNGGDRYRYDFEELTNVSAIQFPVLAMQNTTVPGMYVPMLTTSDSCANTTTSPCYALELSTWLFANRPETEIVRDEVEEFEWYGTVPGQFLFSVQNDNGRTSTIYRANILANQTEDVKIFDDAVDWSVAGSEIWVLTPADGDVGNDLMRSQDGGNTFVKMALPFSVSPSALQAEFLDLEVAEDQVVFVYLKSDDDETGELLAVSGQDSTQLVHVSRRVLVHEDESSIETEVDEFEDAERSALLAPVNGIEGGWILNRLDVFMNVETVVSFDQGRSWNSPVDAACPYTCSSCNLHVEGWAGAMEHGDSDPASHALTPGFVSVVARVASDPTDAWWLSQDGAVTFKRIQDGSYITEVLNGGGLAVAAPVNTTTDDLFYTWNFGATAPVLQDLNASYAPYNFDSLAVEDVIAAHPDARSSSVLLMGAPYSNGAPIAGFAVVFVDFAVTAPATCGSADVGTWQFPASSCILGEQAVFSRKLATANCMLSDSTLGGLSVPMARPACPCTAQDYICDYCYERTTNNECTPSPLTECILYAAAALSYDPTWDVCNGTYSKTRGYAKVYHDVCTPSAADNVYGYEVIPCPQPPPSTTSVPPEPTTTTTTGPEPTSTTTTTGDVPEPEGSGSMMWIIIIVVVILVLLIIAAGVGGFFIYKNKMAQTSTV